MRVVLLASVLVATACTPTNDNNLDELKYVPPAVLYAWEKCLTGDLSADEHTIRYVMTDAEAAAAQRPGWKPSQAMDPANGAYCALVALNAPTDIADQYVNTKLGGVEQRATWDNKRAVWTCSSAGGLDMTITEKPGP